MKNYVISRNIVTKTMIDNYQNYFLTGWRRVVITLCSALGFAFAVTAFMSGDYIQAGLMLAVSIFGLGEILFITHHKKKEYLKIFGDLEQVMFSLSFGHDGFTIVNVNTKMNTKVLYSEITKIDSIKEGYVIVTKNNGFFILNKESLKNGITELNDYLKAQGLKLSRWPK